MTTEGILRTALGAFSAELHSQPPACVSAPVRPGNHSQDNVGVQGRGSDEEEQRGAESGAWPRLLLKGSQCVLRLSDNS